MFALIATTAFAQDTDGLNLVVEGGAEMTFNTETLDYGTILQGSERDRYFELTNTGK